MKRLREFTIARVALGRAGNSLPLRQMLDFQLAHARARDAVFAPFDASGLAARTGGIELHSEARDRAEYLKRPDLGRRLSPESARRLSQIPRGWDAVFVVCDGLSPQAVEKQAAESIGRMTARLEGWKLAPVILCEQGRVAIGDEIGERLGRRSRWCRSANVRGSAPPTAWALT
jgi:ethanolamine ammonia-lyase small subunit